MKHISTIFLRIVLTTGGLFVLLFIILVMPELVEELITFPAGLYIPLLIAMYAAALPFY